MEESSIACLSFKLGFSATSAKDFRSFKEEEVEEESWSRRKRRRGRMRKVSK